MFRQAILSYNHYGQKYTGFKNTVHLLDKYMKSTIKKDFVKCNGNLYDNLSELYKKNNTLIGNRINIGGDHSMAIATGAYSLNNYPDVKFIWIDAHPDINTFESSSTKNVHGMPLAYLTGLSCNSNINFIKNKLPFNNLLYIGIRDIDPFEAEIINSKNISSISPKICNKNIKNVCSKITEFAKDSPIHISFDVDSMDSKIVPCTGTPVKNGLSKKVTKTILSHIINNCNVINMDITELNLELGTQKDKNISLQNTLDIFDSINIVKM